MQEMSLDKISDHLLYQFKSESELVKLISEISTNFTKDREKISKYIGEEKYVSAYTMFYLSTNLKKLEATLKKLDLDHHLLREMEVIDIGSGPGTFTLSFLKLNPNSKISILEKSNLMIKQGKKLVDGFFPNADVSYYSELEKIPKKNKKRFGLFGHSANEMDEEFIFKIVNKLELDFILFIEPGTKEFFSKARSLRTSLLHRYDIKYPCPSQKDCPMSDDDWCHQYLTIKQEKDVERLCQLVKKDRRNLPITIHFYELKNSKLLENASKVIRKYDMTKFSLEWQVCELKEGQNKLINLQVLKKTIPKDKLKRVDMIEAGDNIEYTLEKSFDDKIRGKLNDT